MINLRTERHTYLVLRSSSVLSYCSDICVASCKSYGPSVGSNNLGTHGKTP